MVYALQIDTDIWVVQKKSKSGFKTPKHEIDLIPARAAAVQGKTEMSDEDFDVIRGSGNAFRDLGHSDADREQLRSLLAARIIGVVDDRRLTVREAHELTGIAAADFSRIRQVEPDRFTIDRLMSILARLGQEVEVTVDVHPKNHMKSEPVVQL